MSAANPWAFPRSPNKYDVVGAEGMSLRDYFAAAALAGIFSIPKDQSVFKDCETAKEVFRLRAETAYMAADAMLVEREK